ncbi:MAG: response regulator transcription factor [Flavobacteriales bacterium]|jgi:two-component system alkaline phosphatase synthesis response regulator PhoP
MVRICVVEDDPILMEFILFNLVKEGYSTLKYIHGDHVMANLQHVISCDLVMLDNMLPGHSGIELCKAIRSLSNVPILFLSAKGNTSDRIEGLKAGANDYLAKPFNLEELMLRIQVLIPRQTLSYKLGLFELDFESMEVSNTTTQEIHTLSKKEMTLLKLFVENENRVLSRDEILDKVWGEDVYPTTRTIDNFVLAFRKMFEGDQKHPKYFHSIRGVGYKFINQSN